MMMNLSFVAVEMTWKHLDMDAVKECALKDALWQYPELKKLGYNPQIWINGKLMPDPDDELFFWLSVERAVETDVAEEDEDDSFFYIPEEEDEDEDDALSLEEDEDIINWEYDEGTGEYCYYGSCIHAFWDEREQEGSLFLGVP